MSIVIPTDPFVTPQAQPVYAKVGIFAESGVGKTHFALQAPNPAVIDPENGTQFFVGRRGFSDWKVMRGLSGDIVDQVHAALSFLETGFELDNIWDAALKRNVPFLTNRRATNPDTGLQVHNRETLVLDPVTVLWEGIQFLQSLKVERSERKNKEDFTWKDQGDMKRDYKGLLNRLIQLPMHVIVTAYASDKIVDGKKEGSKADAEKSTIYKFDLFIELFNPLDPKNPDRRDARILKDRSHTYRQGDIVRDVSWNTLVVPILSGLGARHDLDEMVKVMYRTWKSKGISNDAARAIISQQTGKDKTDDLTADEIRQLTDHFAATDGGDSGAGGDPAGGATAPGAEPGGTGDAGPGE
jgi:hypothetical protein